ncbi:TlpA family protein disulfide reductase [Desulfallas thermosapovorans]|uniref:Thiol-disulfide isomerase/thioredoxin n=1 Tax=Desulfallas thermosapovorans DSM 6562 TaxID=1121431 RepID=A0A5S4ZRY6_9FIRM|nr:TlpA disulfide reductase family protein [Desulfallas thermosapovorans]TYO95410.1 thiol-disulfide isomerase/thioredoxin [Desulfallas thermosapovorans DSM 6562]
MRPKIITVLVVAVIVAAGVWLAMKGNNQAAVNPPVTRLAGEVAVSLPAGSKQKELQRGHMPPDFYIIRENLQNRDRQSNQAEQQIYALSDFAGKYVLINFWNTWCPPCREEMPGLNRLYQDYAQENVEFLFINITGRENSVADVETFLAENNYSLPVYLDRRGEVTALYGGVPAIPTTVIVDPRGQVVYAAAGPVTYEKAKSLLGF